MTEAARRQVAKPPRRLSATAVVVWAGLALGTFLAVEALTHGVMLPWFGGFADAMLTFVLILVVCAVLADLGRRHHRTAARHGKRAAIATARHTRRHSGTALRWLAVKTAPRWENREHRPLVFLKVRGGRGEGPNAGGATGDCPGCGRPLPADGTCPTCKANREAGPPDRGTGSTYSWGPAGSPSGWSADDPETAHRWAQHMSTGGGKPQVVTGYPPGGGPGRTVATYVNGKPSTEGVSSMPASPSRIKTEHRAQRAAARSGGPVPSEWGPVIAQTADFEPEDDGELLEWMSRQVTGLSAWAEALVDFYDHATNTIGIDPTASAMLHDVADAAAQAAETMGAAKAAFTEHYELPREFAGNGGLMTHDGRWITGEGA